MSRHARSCSPDEIAALAARIRRLVEAERNIGLTPATGWLVARAVRAFAARPTREQIMAAICGRKDCPGRHTCMRCMGKPNPLGQFLGTCDTRWRQFNSGDIGSIFVGDIPDSTTKSCTEIRYTCSACDLASARQFIRRC
jgi:hypothetical protein